jgi:GTP-binding protein EngB required for normal cell division
MHIYIYKIVDNTRVLLLLYTLLALNSCSCNNPTETTIPTLKPSEVILFLGNPGVGKSTLCNTIFQQPVFNAGPFIDGGGMTLRKQEYEYQNTLYIDTPGLSYEETRMQAAREIEEALKKNSNYKIIFVITIQAGYLNRTDIVTIDTICDAIQVPFEYGLIFNKVTERVMDKITQKGLDICLTSFKKKPYATVILRADNKIEDIPNMYFKADSENRKSLLEFLSKLKSTRIHKNDIKTLDITNYKQRLYGKSD